MNRKLFWAVAPLAIGVTLCIAAEDKDLPLSDPLSTPWLTTTFREVVPVGSWNLHGDIFVTNNWGGYDGKGHFINQPDFWVINPRLFFCFGLTEVIDFQVSPQWVWNTTQGIWGSSIGDLPVGFDIEIVRRSVWRGVPSVTLTVLETFPIGKYQKFHPHRQGVDQTGGGTYATSIDLVIYQLWMVTGGEDEEGHFLSTSLDLGYTITTPVYVKGFNSYGGGYGTKGKVFPGNSFTTIFNFQYTFYKNWLFSLDTTYIYTGKTRFSGKVGALETGEAASVSSPSTQQLTFSPLIEYDVDENVSFLLGVWFSLWGRNADSFLGGSFSVDLYY